MPSSAPLRFNAATSVGKAALILAAMIFASRLAGFGRILVTSYLYGQNAQTDAYNAAFAIPDALSILIAGGALATGFVPVFSGFLARDEHDAARHTFRSLWTLLLAGFGGLTLLLWALTWTPIGLAWAKTQAPTEAILYLELLRILLVAQFVFVCGGIFTGALNALRWFWFPALQPLFFNLGIILLGIAGPRWGYGIESQAWGALLGALVGSLAIQVPAIYRVGLSLAPRWDARDEGVQKVLTSLAPVFFGLASGRIIALILPRMLAGNLPPGSTTAIDNANRVMQLPLDLLASGAAIALFPTISLLAAQGKTTEMRDQLGQTLRRTLRWMGLSMLALVFLGLFLYRFPIGFGQFSSSDCQLAASALVFYAFALPGLGAQQLLARGFYAIRDQKTPVVAGVGASFLFLAAGALAIRIGWGASGLAGAAVIAITLLAAVLWKGLSRRLGSL